MQPSGETVNHNTGERAGPCPFKNVGHDRFHWWPAGNWYCRKECPNCPGTRVPSGGMKGWLDGSQRDQKPHVSKPAVPPPALAKALSYEKNLDYHALGYLRTRGVSESTAKYFHLGRAGRRITIPNIIWYHGKRRCLGIKRRWIGEPPEGMTYKYKLDKGSIGASLFNWNILDKPRPLLLIVESVMDVMLLFTLRIPAICPFGGGSVWSFKWKRFFSNIEKCIVVADLDDNGAGDQYARVKADSLGAKIVHAPDECTDIGEALQRGVDLYGWIRSISSDG